LQYKTVIQVKPAGNNFSRRTVKNNSQCYRRQLTSEVAQSMVEIQEK